MVLHGTECRRNEGVDGKGILIKGLHVDGVGEKREEGGGRREG